MMTKPRAIRSGLPPRVRNAAGGGLPEDYFEDVLARERYQLAREGYLGSGGYDNVVDAAEYKEIIENHRLNRTYGHSPETASAEYLKDRLVLEKQRETTQRNFMFYPESNEDDDGGETGSFLRSSDRSPGPNYFSNADRDLLAYRNDVLRDLSEYYLGYKDSFGKRRGPSPINQPFEEDVAAALNKVGAMNKMGGLQMMVPREGSFITTKYIAPQPGAATGFGKGKGMGKGGAGAGGAVAAAVERDPSGQHDEALARDPSEREPSNRSPSRVDPDERQRRTGLCGGRRRGNATRSKQPGAERSRPKWTGLCRRRWWGDGTGS
ncbi:unnamed protein product [Amoebophrya sp. A120]|nr:unnamed protein product [Amoebophrya sp. A120]|eukprot:GSA120T00018662001.1